MPVKKKLFFVYYAVMFLFMASWTHVDVIPSLPMRFTFLFALVIPLFLYKPTWAPIILTLFLIVSQNSFSSSYMPANRWLYVLVMLGLIATTPKIKHIKPQYVLLILLFFGIFANIFTVTSLDNSFYYYSLLTVYLFAYKVEEDNVDYPRFFSYVFILASLTLSTLYLMYGGQYEHDAVNGEFERDYWMDPNYWGMVVGMGVVASFIELYYKKDNKFFLKILLAIVIVVSIISLFINASRGSILSIAAAFAVIVVSSKSKIWVKIVTIGGVFIFLYYIYNSGVMDYFIYRMTLEGTLEGGSSRTIIWTKKLSAFMEESPYYWLFGLGRHRGMTLGYGNLTGFHNDYLAFFVEYGIIGLVSFLYLLLSPLKEKHNRTIVIAGTIYTASCCFTVEPLTSGFFAYFAFILYTYIWSKSPEVVSQHRLT